MSIAPGGASRTYELDAAAWSVRPAGGSIQRAQVDPAWGDWELEVTLDGAAVFEGIWADGGPGGGDFAVTGGQQYTISVYLRWDGVDPAGFTLQVQSRTGAPGSGGGFLANHNQNLGFIAGSNTRYTATITADASATRLSMLGLYCNGSQVGKLYVDGWQVDSGAVAQPYDGADAGSTSPPQIRQLRPPADLTVEVEAPTGELFRLSPNAAAPDNRPMGMSFKTARGEGFQVASVPLARDFLADHPDLRLLNGVVLAGPGGDVAYEGRTAGLPRERSDRDSLSVDCEGWMSHARQQRHTELIVDRDLGRWGSMSLARRGQIVGLSRQYQDGGGVDLDAAGASLRTELRGPWNAFVHCEYWYRAPSAIGSIDYAFTAGPTINPAVQTQFDWRIYGSANDSVPNENTGNLRASSGTGTLALTQAQRYGAVYLTYNTGPAGTDGQPYAVSWRLAVRGNHGLPRLPRPSSDFAGHAVSDIIRHLFSRYAPKIALDGVRDTTYPVPHAVWHEPTTVHESALELNKYHLWELGVWDNRTLHYGPVDLSVADWQVRAGQDGCTVTTPGDTIESAYNGVAVTYTDFGGQVWRVTPDDATDLRDGSDWIAANQWGEKVWAELPVSWPCVEADAVQIGRAWLAEQNRAKRPSTIRVGMHVRDRYGDWQPSWKVRAGDTIAIVNHPSDAPRLITETSWSDHELVITTDDAIPTTQAWFDRVMLELQAGGVS